MPRIYVEWRTGKTPEVREETARRITDAVVQATKVAPEHVSVFFREYPPEVWFKAGKLYRPVRSAGS